MHTSMRRNITVSGNEDACLARQSERHVASHKTVTLIGRWHEQNETHEAEREGLCNIGEWSDTETNKH